MLSPPLLQFGFHGSSLEEFPLLSSASSPSLTAVVNRIPIEAHFSSCFMPIPEHQNGAREKFTTMFIGLTLDLWPHALSWPPALPEQLTTVPSQYLLPLIQMTVDTFFSFLSQCSFSIDEHDNYLIRKIETIRRAFSLFYFPPYTYSQSSLLSYYDGCNIPAAT